MASATHPVLRRSRVTTISTDRLAHLIGCSPQQLYRQLESNPDALPIQPIKVGARYRWPAKVARMLGVTPEFVVNGCGDDPDALAAAMTAPNPDDDAGTGDAA